MEVYDLENKLRDFEYVKSKYGVAFRRATVEPGKKVYRLTHLFEKTGHHSLISNVSGLNGEPLELVDVAFYWVDAPDPPDPPTMLYPHDWFRKFVHGLTNVNGDVGPAMGKGAYHGEGEGGPHAVWIRDPSIPSDICERLGMLAGTFHDHIDQRFTLTLEGGQREGMFYEVISKRRFDRTEGTNHIAINCEEKSVADFSKIQGEVLVGNDWKNPDWKDPNPVYPRSSYHFNIYAGYNPTPGEVDRTFWIVLRHSDTKILLCDPLSFKFKTREYGIHHAYLMWGTPSAPEPEPEPPLPPDPEPPVPAEPHPYLVALNRIATALEDIGEFLGAQSDEQ